MTTKQKEIIQCGNANPNGNVSLFYKGGCKQKLKKSEAYRCVGCGGWFHKECILKHFELEKEHDYGRQEERKKLKEEFKKMIEERILLFSKSSNMWFRKGTGALYTNSDEIAKTENVALTNILKVIDNL